MSSRALGGCVGVIDVSCFSGDMSDMRYVFFYSCSAWYTKHRCLDAPHDDLLQALRLRVATFKTKWEHPKRFDEIKFLPDRKWG